MSVARALSTAPSSACRSQVTFEEYYASEQRAEIRSEFVDGVVRQMSGAAPDHIVIVANLGDVGPTLKRLGICRLLGQDTQIPIPDYNVYTYPDAVIACPPQFATRPKGALLNPKVLFEVLSPSTEGYDRGDKFRYYRSLDTLEEYVLVSAAHAVVEVYPRSRGWAVQTYEGRDAIAKIESIGLELPLRDLYGDVEFSVE